MNLANALTCERLTCIGVITIFVVLTLNNSNMEIEYCSELEYEIKTDCSQDDEGFDSLKSFVKSSTAFFKLLGADIIYKEFWSDNEGDMFYSRTVGYNITVTFYGQGSYITRFIGATTLFFELYNAIKTNENLYFVPKKKHN